MRSLHHLLLLGLVCSSTAARGHGAADLLSGPAQTQAQTVAPAVKPVGIYPLEARLAHSLDPLALKPGDHVLTKLVRAWTDGDCTLPAGSAISGEVVAQHAWTRQDKQTRATLQFHYQCHEQPRQLQWIALFAPEDFDVAGLHGSPVTTQSFRSSSFGQGDYSRSAGNMVTNHVDMSGRQNPSLPLFVDPEPDRHSQRPTEAKRGMVWHLPNIALAVSDSTPPSTAVASTRRSFKLSGESVLVMVPKHLPETMAAQPFPAEKVVRHPLPAISPEMTQCPADRCTSLTTAPLPSIAPDISIALHRYGSVKGQPGEISEFEYSSAIAFLGEDELLVCGARQGLARHAANERPEDHPHTVQALLWNRHTGQLERTAEWFVPNRQQYLWPLADGRVLVHDGEQLVWFGKGLQREASLPLDGPLAFVSATGDGRHTLVGTIRELHSKTEHAELYHSDNQAPEEQVREVVYDDKLRLVSEAEESSRAMPPLLWNDGRLMLRHRGGNLWYFREFAWDGSQRDFGTLTSSCIPHTAALAGDMLLVEGCETHSLNAWARVLRPDGSLVLRSTIRPDDLYPFASTRSLRSFVLVSPRLVPSANRDGVYHAADVAAETVRVVRSSDGVVEFAAEVHEPNTSFQPAAVDMHGSGVAILDGETVRLYCLPLTARAPLMQTGSR